MSLLSREAELHAMVSALSDGIFSRGAFSLFVVEKLSRFFTQTLHQVVNWLCAKALVR